MAQSAGGKVVPLGDRSRATARLTKQESADMLAGCRELALERMARALSGMLDRVEADLFELAEKSFDREAQTVFLDARAHARDKRALIEATFGRHFVECFNRQAMGAPAAARAPTPATEDEFSLVGNEDLDESLAVRELSLKLKASCEGELGALSQRLGFLLEKPELDDDANPVSPAAICSALKDACDQIEAGVKVRITLLRQLERHAEAELQRIYHDLNSHLVELSILPDVRPGIRRAAATPAKRKAPRTEAPASQSPPSRARAEARVAAAPGDVFAALAQLLGASDAGAGASSGGAGDVGPTAPQGPPSSFVAELTRMHREGGPAISSDDPVLMNVVRRIKSAPQSATLGTVDAMTIDIVAMLFDYIFEDAHIPASAKALLGRLQIPILKVALLDKGFFSSKSHPARRLVDLLAESAMGLDESSARAHPALEMIEEVVERVLAEFDTDLALFESLAARVAAFIDKCKEAEVDVVERSARLVEERERDEAAQLAAEEEVARRLATRAWVSPPVREMLEKTWTRALARTQRQEGEGSAAWQSLVMTMEELLWSVEPKVEPEDRKRLITMLPAMLKSLHEGMERGELAEPERGVFLGTLVDCHALAVKAGLRGMAALPQQGVAPPRRDEPGIRRAVVPAGDIQVEEIRLHAPRGAGVVRNVFTRTGVWTNLQRGTWVEFARPDGPTSRARLTWISPNKGVYLFTNPASPAAATSISPEALAEQMRLGEARIIDDAPLVGRAVDSMLATLREGRA